MSFISSRYGNEKGFVLAVAMMFLTLLGMLGTTAMVMKTTDLKIGVHYKTNAQAFNIAHAGLAMTEVDLKNDLVTDQDLANSNFNAKSVTITITPSSDDFYTVFNNVGFGEGTYKIEFKNLDDGEGGLDPTTILVRSTGMVGGSSVTLEAKLSAEDVSPWNNAAFADGGGGSAPITGNVVIAGSVHLLGTGLNPDDIAFTNQTGDCRNDNTGMDSTLASKIAAGGVTSDLNAKFRVKNGRVDMSLGSGKIGSSSSPFKGIYVTNGLDGGDGVNEDIIGGDNSGAGQNLYADKGASFPEDYDLDDLGVGVPMPTIDTEWMDNNSLDLTSTTDTEDPLSLTPKGLITGDLELTGKFKDGPTYYYPDIEQGDGSTFEDSTKGIRYRTDYPNPGENLLEIKGIIKVSSLTISTNIQYKTYGNGGTIYVIGTGTGMTNAATKINGNVLPQATFPTPYVLGVISWGDMLLGGGAQIKLTGAYYCAGKVFTDLQTQLAGTIVCKKFDITAQVPELYQIPSLVDNLPPGMPGKDPVWVFTEKTWKDVYLE